MSGFGIAFLALQSALLLMLPRRWAALPLLLTALYMTRGQVWDVAGANVTVLRALIAVGLLRVVLRGEGLAHGLRPVDGLMLLWAAVLLGTSPWHVHEGWMFRSGLVWTELGSYLLLRVFLRDVDDVRRVFTATACALLPLVVLLLFEKATDRNLFAPLGGVNADALLREGRVRASGPFAHAILAGTVGAVGVAIGLALRRSAPLASWAALVAGAGIVLASNSSGPILMVLFVVLGRLAWTLRDHMRAVRWTVAACVLGLAAVMKDPVYFLMARVDISGGSQGYFRAQLIRSSIAHLSEWWAVGTDRTRHWMSSGIPANDRHTDITNHFLAMGVLGGVALLLVVAWIPVQSWRELGRALRARAHARLDERLLVWTLGALLLGYFMTFWSISLFDQSVVFYYLALAAIQAVQVPEPAPVAAAARGATPHPA